MMSTATLVKEAHAETLTEKLQSKLSNPASTPEFDLHGTVNKVLNDVGLTVADSGGKLSFYGQDPIIPSPHRFGAMAAVGPAARSVALAALWKDRTGHHGMTDQVVLSKTPGSFRTVLAPRGSSKPEWLKAN